MSGLTPEEARQLTDRLKLFAQPQRLQILSLLLDGPRAVSVLESETGIGQPVLSQQLGALRRAGTIRAERESRAIFYSFLNEAEAGRVRALLGLLGGAVVSETVGETAWARSRGGKREEAGAVFARVGGPADRGQA
ncbi:ArsR/SmtB family transcription factor [Gluconacetobacter sp. Hr-1-5]|uniref:ArsR/SmtB family transcription factor n=1 Tax=Gluconacetobacter sp. Hr-1-5 TaxID=3395370 RepID=UPI003B5239B5